MPFGTQRQDSRPLVAHFARSYQRRRAFRRVARLKSLSRNVNEAKSAILSSRDRTMPRYASRRSGPRWFLIVGCISAIKTFFIRELRELRCCGDTPVEDIIGSDIGNGLKTRRLRPSMLVAEPRSFSFNLALGFFAAPPPAAAVLNCGERFRSGMFVLGSLKVSTIFPGNLHSPLWKSSRTWFSAVCTFQEERFYVAGIGE